MERVGRFALQITDEAHPFGKMFLTIVPKHLGFVGAGSGDDYFLAGRIFFDIILIAVKSILTECQPYRCFCHCCGIRCADNRQLSLFLHQFLHGAARGCAPVGTFVIRPCGSDNHDQGTLTNAPEHQALPLLPFEICGGNSCRHRIAFRHRKARDVRSFCIFGQDDESRRCGHLLSAVNGTFLAVPVQTRWHTGSDNRLRLCRGGHWQKRNRGT